VGNSFNNSFALNRELILTPQDKPYNKTFAEWTRDWWNWHLSIQDTKGQGNESLFHPRENYSPEKCSLNQNDGPVWFLADGKDLDDNSNPEVRNCTVPKGKALLVQIVGSGCGMNEGFKNDQELFDCAVWVLPDAELSASVDGVDVINTKNNPIDREALYVKPFKTTLSYPENNLYDLDPGTYPATVAGYFLLVRPLPEGTHEIQFKETAIDFEQGVPGDKRLSNVKYIIAVE